MSGKSDTLDSLRSSRLVAVLRKIPREVAAPLCRALAAGGVNCVEVTMDTAGALQIIETLSTLPNLTVGAGTVLDPEGAAAAIRAGARFIVSPCLNVEVIKLCNRWGVVVIPGTLSPTEILSAAEAGADLVKVFPASIMGARYFREIRGPLSHINLMASGGISAENAAEYLAAGVDILAVGSSLVDLQLVAERRWDEVRARATRFRRIVEGLGA